MSISTSLAALQAAKSDIANAITEKGGTVGADDGMSDFAADIATIPTDITPNLQNKTVTPTISQQSITADAGYDGLGTVTVTEVSLTGNAAVNHVLSGKTFYNTSLTKKTGTIQTYSGGNTITSNGTIAVGGKYCANNITVNASGSTTFEGTVYATSSYDITIPDVTGNPKMIVIRGYEYDNTEQPPSIYGCYQYGGDLLECRGGLCDEWVGFASYMYNGYTDNCQFSGNDFTIYNIGYEFSTAQASTCFYTIYY